ncbi:MAG: tRNA (adenosine(37)-N6)-dimethylallyltransferase MiaA [Peptococcaceae bacterium]|nr:tRNA (adenosine(37)-N6)-dimethylallyltransferase MiaA [Peptococcaceae bacterium]
MTKKPIVVLVGPTAVGKTAASIALAQQLNGEIISGDSMQIYRGLDIGTAKITPEEMQGVTHHLLDIRDIEESFSAADFKVEADKIIADIHQRGKLPIIVGGTGFYINSLIYEYHFGEAITDEAYRTELQAFVDIHGKEALHQRLAEIDAATAARLHANDVKRVMRALEVYHVTGKPLSSMENQVNKQVLRYPTVYLGLGMERERLYERINQRVDLMMEQGLLEETKTALAKGVSPQAQSMTSLGYRQIIQYLQGEVSLEKAIELIKRDTRHFAKRQLTWFRHDPNLIWVMKDGKTEEEVETELLAKIKEIIH